MALPQSNGNLPPMRMCLCGTIAPHAVNVNNARQSKGNDGASVIVIKDLKILAYSTLKHYFPITEPGIKDKSVMSAECNIKIC